MSKYIETLDDEVSALRKPSPHLLLPEDEGCEPSSSTPWDIQTLSVGVIAIGVILYGLYSARSIMFPIVLSVLVAFPLRPIMRTLRKARIPQFVSATIVVGTLIGITGLGAYSLSGPAKEWLQTSPAKLKRAEARLRSFVKPLEGITAATKQVEEMTDGAQKSGTVKVQLEQPKLTNTVVNKTGDFAVSGMITTSLVFLLLVFGDDLLKSVLKVLPTRRDCRHLEQVCLEVERTVSQYLLTYTCINIGLGIVIGVSLWLMGMPNPILWGVMAAALNYIPFVGLVVGAAVVFLVAMLSFDSLAYACLAPGIYLLANGIEANVITPTLLGRSMKLSTIMIFLAIVVWGWMWGVGGAIIAVPALAVAKIVCERSQRLAPLSTILSG